jgi:hypothetical protein
MKHIKHTTETPKRTEPPKRDLFGVSVTFGASVV